MRKYLLSFILLLLFACNGKGQHEPQNTTQQTSIEEIQKKSSSSDEKKYKIVPGVDFRYAAKKSMPAVVHIKVKFKQEERRNYYENDPFWEFFGEPYIPNPSPKMGSGSGVILTPNGYIVTNNHVVQKADSIVVTLSDNRSYEAKLIGTDPQTDLALIKIDADSLPFLKYGNSDSVEVGEWVLAVGNPFNLSSTVTAGIVSAKGRNIHILRNKYAIESFIQTDAAVNPGNSGGALVNLQGELIGINTAIASPTGAYAGYAFAIPVNIVKKIVDDLLNYGYVKRGFLGITIIDMDAQLAQQLGIDRTEGVYVDNVMDNSAADKAGIKPHDVIIELDGKPVKKASELIEYIARKRPGEKVEIKFIRDGKVKTTTAILKAKTEGKETFASANAVSIPNLGIKIAPLSERDKKVVKNGIKVVEIGPGPVREYTDMKVGFIITHVNDTPVKSVKQFRELMLNEKGGVLLQGKYPNSKREYFYGFKIK